MHYSPAANGIGASRGGRGPPTETIQWQTYQRFEIWWAASFTFRRRADINRKTLIKDAIMEINIVPQEQQLIPAIHAQTSAVEAIGPADGNNSAELSGFRTIRSITDALPEDVTPRAKAPNLEVQTIAGPEKTTTAASPVGLTGNKGKSSRKKKTAKSSGIQKIASLSDGLDKEQKVELDRLLKEIPEALKDYSIHRRKFGKSLYELQAVFAKAGKNGRFQTCLRRLHIPKSTAYDLIGRHKRIVDLDLPAVILQAADEVNIDLGAPELYSRVEDLRFSREGLDLAKAKEIIGPLAKKAKREVTALFGPGITEEEKKAFKVFDAIRRSMGDFTGIQKKKALSEALNYYAHYDLGYKEQTSIELVPTKAEDDWVLLPSQGKATAKEVTCTKKL
jgi:hypothetical protein